MPPSLRARVGYALEKVPMIRWALFRFYGWGVNGKLYENRINGHLVTREGK